MVNSQEKDSFLNSFKVESLDQNFSKISEYKITWEAYFNKVQ